MKLPTSRGHNSGAAGQAHNHEHSTPHLRATWNGAVIADSCRTIVVESNHYFPPEDVRWALLHRSDENSTCPRKGEASYVDVVVDDERNAAAGWYYPEPKPAAAEIRDYVAFWQGIEIEAT